MLFDPRACGKPGNAIAVEQRRLGERFFHAENVTGFNTPSNPEKLLCYRGLLPSAPAKSPIKFRDEPFFKVSLLRREAGKFQSRHSKFNVTALCLGRCRRKFGGNDGANSLVDDLAHES